VNFFGVQQAFSIGCGTVMLVIGITLLLGKRITFNNPMTSRLSALIRTMMGRLFRLNSFPSFVLIGLVNGLLPCGFVYVALAGAAAAGNPVSGAVFMFSFGIGTAPILLITSLIPVWGNVRKYVNTRKLIPVFTILFALLFILRGLNLGIPFVSPKQLIKTQVQKQQIKPAGEIDCCE
jgi:sulfite exporter TauE/SafE